MHSRDERGGGGLPVILDLVDLGKVSENAVAGLKVPAKAAALATVKTFRPEAGCKEHTCSATKRAGTAGRVTDTVVAETQTRGLSQ